MAEKPSSPPPPKTAVESQMPTLPWQNDLKPPWRPSVADRISWVFGPLAGAIVTFINLRRLGAPRKAHWTLWLSVFGCAVYGASFFFLKEGTIIAVGHIFGWFVGPFLYPGLQKTEFANWRQQNPGAKTGSGWFALGWGCVGLLGLLAAVLAGALTILLNEEVENVQMKLSRPEKVYQGQEFVIQLEVQNTADQPQELTSLHFTRDFLEAVTIQRTEPPFSTIKEIRLAGKNSYYINWDIPRNGKTTVRIHASAQKPGKIPCQLDVCIHRDSNCLVYRFITEITPTSPAPPE